MHLITNWPYSQENPLTISNLTNSAFPPVFRRNAILAAKSFLPVHKRFLNVCTYACTERIPVGKAQNDYVFEPLESFIMQAKLKLFSFQDY
jgi:hypothetical protein